MSSSSKAQVIGFRYFAGLHYVLARAIEKVTQIDVGERTAWSGDVTSGDIAIDAPDLHGGDEQEGGVQGTLTIQDGNATQSLDAYLAAKITGDQSNYRGVAGAVWKGGLLSARSPYPKPWRFLVKRVNVLDDLTVQWNPTKADINGDLNPAHIIREVLTNPVWGLGISELEVDAVSFLAVAETLYDEDFGLSFLWADGDLSVKDFLANVLAHIDGVMYVDPATGLFVLKLVREDYVVGDLDEYGQDDISEVRSFVRTSPGEITTQMEITYMNRATWEPDTVVLHNLAMSDVQGGNIPDKREYLGITTKDLALVVGTRDLRGSSAMLAKCKIVGNRRMAALEPGDVFKLSWPPLGIDQMIVRVVNVEYGTLSDGKVNIDVVEDVFGITEAIYTSGSSNWTTPYTDPADPADRALLELPLWSVVRVVAPESQVTNIADAAAYVQTLAKRPSQDSLSYDRQFDLGTGYTSQGNGYFSPHGDLVSGVGMLNTTITLESANALDLVQTGTYAVIGEEIVEVTAVDTGTGEITVNRGVLDTVPVAHLSGVTMWFPEEIQIVADSEYSEGDTIDFKPLVRTSNGVLAIGDATAVSETLTGRLARPFTPGRFRIDDLIGPERTYDTNGVVDVDAAATDLVFQWRHRDRLQQTATFVAQGDASNYGPEAGTTYTLRFKTTGGTLVRTVTGETGVAYTYTSANQTTDFGSLVSSFKVELESVRGGITSHQMWDIQVDRSL